MPSLIEEITVGVEDRENNYVGYIHHFWVCRDYGPSTLEMMAKPDLKSDYLPLRFYENLRRKLPERDARNVNMFWTGDFNVVLQDEQFALDQIREKIKTLAVTRGDYLHDKVLRLARRARAFAQGGLRPFSMQKDGWWKEMLRISKPYADPDMFKKAGGR